LYGSKYQKPLAAVVADKVVGGHVAILTESGWSVESLQAVLGQQPLEQKG